MKPLTRELDSNPFNPECREPARYHITRPGATEIEVGAFLAGLARAAQPRTVVETGTSWADSTIQIAEAVKLNGHGRVVTIDLAEHKVTRAKRRLAGLPAVVLRGDATTIDWPAQGVTLVDMVFIDGGADRRAEFDNLHPHLAPGALVAFHDVSNGLEPARVVTSLHAAGVITAPLYLPTPRGLAVARLA
jgi:predicted O-methyltransferase YrrM